MACLWSFHAVSRRCRDFAALALLASMAYFPTAAAQPAEPLPVFKGCGLTSGEIGSAASESSTSERRIDPITNREFMSFSIDEAEASAGGDTSCWARLDGVWQEQVPITLDTSFKADGWAGASSELSTLAHGVYTRPDHISIAPGGRPDEVLRVQFPFSSEAPVDYLSRDGLPLSAVLKRGGEIKLYTTDDPFVLPQYQTLEVDVSRTGYIRLRFGGRVYQRPRPGTSRSEWSGQISDRDPFMIGFTMENIVANRRGYDVVTQDPARFLQNPEAEVFAHSRQGYAIDEKRIVPLGLRLVKEDIQGATHYTRAISSEREYQSANRSAFGFGISVSPPLKLGGGGAGPGLNIGASFGYQKSVESFQALKRGSYLAEETGVMRYKKYALAMDPAYAILSDRFIDAVEDAVRYGDYGQIIETFGTHYPYAVTYGASGQVSQFVSREAFTKAYGTSVDETYEGSLSAAVIQANAFRSTGHSSSSSFSETNEFGEKTFSAVGGNGSWNEAGFVAGDASYPILADLRPLDELLNEINFPGEPDIYVHGRRELTRAIDTYLSGYMPSDAKLVPDPRDLVQVNGCWAFVDKAGQHQQNMIRMTSDRALVANRHGSAAVFDYILSRPNTFEAAGGSGTYYFAQGGVATWHSPTYGGVIRMRRIGDTC